MKLEVGMHVRTKRRTLQPPQIARIINISKDVVLNQYFIELDKNLIPSYKHHIYEEAILKASHNIVDLIEAGDYVNGSRVELITDYNEKYLGYKIGSCYLRLGTFEIKSIVTKEQFEVMQYEVV